MIRTLLIDGDESKWRDKCEPYSSFGIIGINGSWDGITAICPQCLALWVNDNKVSELAGHFAY
jgi:hypothetical protein